MIRADERGRPCSASAGGPLLIVSAEAARHWRGAADGIDAGTDYDRACEPEDYAGTPCGGIGWVDVGAAKALVLAGATGAYFARDSEGGCLVRDHAGGGDPTSIDEDGWQRYEAVSLALGDGRLFMFDAALVGSSDAAAIEAPDGVAVLELGPGQWAVWLATDEDENDFIRFRRLG